jgi:quercetin dioxygenase-like cupin family protein
MALEHTRDERVSRLLTEGLHVFDLDNTLQGLRSEPEYESNGRNGTTLVKNGELRVVLMAMPAGGEMADHHAPGPITVQVLEGEIEFSVGGSAHLIRPGKLLSLSSGETHAVKAIQASAFLLTIAPLPKPAQ